MTASVPFTQCNKNYNLYSYY